MNFAGNWHGLGYGRLYSCLYLGLEFKKQTAL
jgi:hypothetical protein